jgi:hypothetical protein
MKDNPKFSKPDMKPRLGISLSRTQQNSETSI